MWVGEGFGTDQLLPQPRLSVISFRVIQPCGGATRREGAFDTRPELGNVEQLTAVVLLVWNQPLLSVTGYKTA